MSGSQQRQEELKGRATMRVSNHLGFVDDDDGQTLHYMGEGKNEIHELLVGQKGEIVLTRENRPNLVTVVSRCSNNLHLLPVGTRHVLVLVVDEGLEREQHHGAGTVRDSAHRS